MSYIAEVVAINLPMPTVTYRRALNSQQIAVIGWLHDFRFSTSKQLAAYLGRTDRKGIQKKLQILEEQGFISKRYDKSYKLLGRPAAYYLTPCGAKQLAQHGQEVSTQAVKALYRNKTVSQAFIAHCLNIVEVVLRLQAVYGSKLTLNTTMQLRSLSYLPSWWPDLYLQLRSGSSQHHYFMDIWDGTEPFFVTVRKVRNYLTYADEGDWPTDQFDFPTLLMVCVDDNMERKLRRQIKRALDDAYTDDIVFATITYQRLIGQIKPADRIWHTLDWDGGIVRTTLGGIHAA